MKNLSILFLAALLPFLVPACGNGNGGGGDADAADHEDVSGDVDQETDGMEDPGADSVEDPGDDRVEVEDTIGDPGEDVDDEDGGGETMATAVIGPEGGTLTSTDGRYSIEVQPGTVEEDTTFTIELIADPAEGVIGPSYRLGPEDVEFNLPIFSTLAYDPAELGGTAEEDLWLVTWDEEEGAWMPDNRSTVNADDNELLGERLSFSEVSQANIEDALAALAMGCTEIEDVPETIYVDDEFGSDDTLTGSEDSPFKSLRIASSRLFQRFLLIDEPSGRCLSYAWSGKSLFSPGHIRVSPGCLRAATRSRITAWKEAGMPRSSIPGPLTWTCVPM